LYAGKFNNHPQGSRTTGRPKDRRCNRVQIAVDVKLKTGLRGQKIELTGRSPLRRRRRRRKKRRRRRWAKGCH